MPEFREIASGLMFPEGPIAMPDGSVVLVEMARRTLSRVAPDGTVSVIAELGGSPNGAAIGPDGRCYVCNNGGSKYLVRDGRHIPVGTPDDWRGGSIQVVDLDTGRFDTLYTECDGRGLRGPNDLVFDAAGGFWFTDHGKHRERDEDVTGIFYAHADGSFIKEAIFPLNSPNGIGLSPAEDRVYIAQTPTGRLWAFDLEGPGRIKGAKGETVRGHKGTCVAGVGGLQMFDSLAVEGNGNICVATLVNGGITVISPDGTAIEHLPLPDAGTTNICFGGPGLRTAYVTLSTTGRLVAVDWPRPGLPLNFLNK